MSSQSDLHMLFAKENVIFTVYIQGVTFFENSGSSLFYLH